MLVPTMNETEVYLEVAKDFVKVMQTSFERLKQTYDRDRRRGGVKRDSAFPKDYSLKSHAKNPWLIFLQKDPGCEKYKGPESVQGCLVTYHYGKKGLTVYRAIEGGYISVYWAHFFKRYNERMQLGITNPIDVVRTFFLRNMNADYTVYLADGQIRSVGVTEEGFLFGSYFDDFLYNKTFVSRNMLFKSQAKFEKAFVEDLRFDYFRRLATTSGAMMQRYQGTNKVFFRFSKGIVEMPVMMRLVEENQQRKTA